MSVEGTANTVAEQGRKDQIVPFQAEGAEGGVIRGNLGSSDCIYQKEDGYAVSERQSQQASREEQGPSPRGQQWSRQDESRLIELHNEKGNKWVQIARQLGRTDNSVKNHYHSSLRKALRKINAVINDYMRPAYKPFKTNILSRVVQASEGRYRTTPDEDSLGAFSLKNAIISYGVGSDSEIQDQQEIQEVKELVERLAIFNKGFQNKNGQKGKRQRHNMSKYKEIMGLISENFGKSNPSLKTIAGDGSEEEAGEDGLEEVSLLKKISGQSRKEKRNETVGVVKEESSGEVKIEEEKGAERDQAKENGWNYPGFYYFNPFVGVSFYSMYNPTPAQLHSGKQSSFSFCSPPAPSGSNPSISS